MRITKILLTTTAAFALSAGAWADGGPMPEEEPPLPVEEPMDEDVAPEPEEAAASHNEYVLKLELGAGWALVNNVDDSAGLDDDSFPLIEGAARANIPLADNVAAQLDAGGLATFGDRDGAGEDYLQTVFFAAAHLNYRTPDYAAGVLFQTGSANGGNDENGNFFNLGAEGLYNWTDLTAILQGGYFWADDETADDVMTDAWWGRGVVRYYFGDDTRVQAEGSYGSGDESDEPGVDVTAIGWGLRIDHAFTGGPVAAYLGYRGTNVESDDGVPEEIIDHTISIGLNVRFGNAGTLKEADRSGPSFDTPDVGRWIGWTAGVVD